MASSLLNFKKADSMDLIHSYNSDPNLDETASAVRTINASLSGAIARDATTAASQKSSRSISPKGILMDQTWVICVTGRSIGGLAAHFLGDLTRIPLLTKSKA